MVVARIATPATAPHTTATRRPAQRVDRRLPGAPGDSAALAVAPLVPVYDSARRSGIRITLPRFTPVSRLILPDSELCPDEFGKVGLELPVVARDAKFGTAFI